MKSMASMLLIAATALAQQSNNPAEPVKIAEGSYSITGVSARNHKKTTSIDDHWQLFRNGDGSLEYRTAPVPTEDGDRDVKINIGYVFASGLLTRYYWDFRSKNGGAHFDCSLANGRLQCDLSSPVGYRRSQLKTYTGPAVVLSGEMYVPMNDMALMNLSVVLAAGRDKGKRTVKAFVYQSDSVEKGLQIDDENEQVECLGEEIIDFKSKKIPVIKFAFGIHRLYVTKSGVLLRMKTDYSTLELDSFQQFESIIPELK